MPSWLFFPSLGVSVDGNLLYCSLNNNLITTTWRPVPQPSDGTFLYCSQDINQFDRTP